MSSPARAARRPHFSGKNAEVDSYLGNMNRTFSFKGILEENVTIYPVNFYELITNSLEEQKDEWRRQVGLKKVATLEQVKVLSNVRTRSPSNMLTLVILAWLAN